VLERKSGGRVIERVKEEIERYFLIQKKILEKKNLKKLSK